MKKLWLIIAVASFFALTMAGISSAHGKKADTCEKSCCTSASMTKASFRMDMRKLWEEHIGWTKAYITSAVNGIDGTDKVAARLLKNQEDIGNAIKPFYGDEAGAKLTALLKDHILLAADLVSAAKAGDGAKAAEAEKKWYANGDDIATFLSGANKNWSKGDLKEMMDTHLSLTKAIAVAEIGKDQDAAIKAADQNHEHILKMADALSDGIIKQFPKKFKK
jgi:hypothetical protein